MFQNVPAIGRYKNVEAAVTKRFGNRWGGGVGVGYNWTREHNSGYASGSPNSNRDVGYPNSPNEIQFSGTSDGSYQFTGWGFNAHASYEAPWGIHISPVFRNQAGQNFGRTLNVNAPTRGPPATW